MLLEANRVVVSVRDIAGASSSARSTPAAMTPYGVYRTLLLHAVFSQPSCRTTDTTPLPCW